MALGKYCWGEVCKASYPQLRRGSNEDSGSLQVALFDSVFQGLKHDEFITEIVWQERMNSSIGLVKAALQRAKNAISAAMHENLNSLNFFQDFGSNSDSVGITDFSKWKVRLFHNRGFVVSPASPCQQLIRAHYRTLSSGQRYQQDPGLQ